MAVKKTTLLCGKKSKKGKYKHVPLEETIGKKVEAAVMGFVDGNYGDEPCIYLLFDDGTKHGFVLPSDNWE